jgi:hypothetical protein
MHTFLTAAGDINSMQLPIISRALTGDLVYNIPVLSLICANIATIIMAILGNWDLATVMFIYWVQSIIIGFFTVLGMLLITVPPPVPDLEPPVQQPERPRTIYIRNPWMVKCLLVGIFALPYGIFHWAYYTFIVDSGIFGIVHFSGTGIWFSCSLFFANHLYSFIFYNHQRFHDGMDIAGELFTPFRRIIPMHMTIIFGGILLLILTFIGIQSTLPVLVLSLVIKTSADVTAHRNKHQLQNYQDGTAAGS